MIDEQGKVFWAPMDNEWLNNAYTQFKLNKQTKIHCIFVNGKFSFPGKCNCYVQHGILIFYNAFLVNWFHIASLI